MSTKSSKHSYHDHYYLCPPSTDQDVETHKPPLVSAIHNIAPPSTQEKISKESLGDYLPNIPGDLNSSGPADWSLQHLILNPPRADNELSYFSGTQFVGFILKEGEPLPDVYKMEHSTFSFGGEKLKKKHRSKKHKINQPDSLGHLLDKIPPDVPTPTAHGEPKMEANYGAAIDARRKDKKPKKTKRKKDEKKKKKTRQKDEDGRPTGSPYNSYHMS